MPIARLLTRFMILAVFAVVVGVVQLDMAARSNPGLSALVPGNLGGYAQAQTVAVRMSQDIKSAGPIVKSLLSIRPIEARHLTALSIWEAETGNTAAASKALGVAADRGWRDPVVQIAVLASAMEEGKVDVAAARLDALTRTEAPAEMIDRAIDLMTATPAGKAALAARLSRSEYLADQLIDYADARVGKEMIPVELFSQAGNKDSFTCDRRSRLAYIMLKRGLGEASEVWNATCGAPNKLDLAFNPLAENPGPLDWTFPSGAGLLVQPGEKNGSVSFANRNLLTKLMAFRYLTLKPGTYRFAFTDGGNSGPTRSGGEMKSGVETRVTCPAKDGGDRQSLLRQSDYGIFELNVPASCPVQFVRIFVGRGRGDDVVLRLQ